MTVAELPSNLAVPVAPLSVQLAQPTAIEKSLCDFSTPPPCKGEVPEFAQRTPAEGGRQVKPLKLSSQFVKYH